MNATLRTSMGYMNLTKIRIYFDDGVPFIEYYGPEGWFMSHGLKENEDIIIIAKAEETTDETS